MFKKKLEEYDTRITSVEVSGDGETWLPLNSAAFGGAFAGDGGLPHLMNLALNGERIFARTTYVTVYSNQKTSMPKTGAVYELKLIEMQPIRRLIDISASDSEPAEKRITGGLLVCPLCIHDEHEAGKCSGMRGGERIAEVCGCVKAAGQVTP